MKKMNNKGFSLIELIIVIAIMAVLVAVIAPNLTSYLGNSKKKTDNSNADTLESIINAQLQNYCSDDSITAAASTDADMLKYDTVQNLIAKAAKPSTGYDSQFEQNVKDNIPTKYMKSDGTLNTKQDGFQFYLKITGTKDSGFSAEVECAKTNPWSQQPTQ